jgi:FkbM family methyltransferase
VNYKQLNYYLSLIESSEDYIDNYLKTLSETSSEIIRKSISYETLKNLEKCKDVYAFLEDELSQKVYLRMLAKKIMECKYYFDVYSPNQYFDKALVKLSDEEVFFDVGAFDGDTVEKFIKKSHNKYHSIYAFEPDSSMFPQLVAHACKYRDVAFLNVGLYDETQEVTFKNAILGSSHVSEGDLKEVIESTEYVNKLVMKGDSLNLKPTFVKMDIEGAELKALSGLEMTIKSNKPKLAICAYHKPEDFWTIPTYIKNIESSYKIYFRHHSYTDTETVCYAIM